jgi:hypothetical protein
MNPKRKWEIGTWMAFTAVLAIAVTLAVRHWLMNEALVRAVWDSKPSEVQRLLRRGANPNHRDREFRVPMVYYSVTSGATLKTLLQAGANPNTRTPGGEVPIVRAAGQSYLDIVQILLRSGADVNAANSDGETALLAAASGGASPELVKTLLDAGADVNARNRIGLSPLRLAQQQLELAGSNLSGRGREEAARRQRTHRTEILRLLKEAGAVH